MAFSGDQTTRHGLYGGPRGPYGDFSGKTEEIILAKRIRYRPQTSPPVAAYRPGPATPPSIYRPQQSG